MFIFQLYFPDVRATVIVVAPNETAAKLQAKQHLGLWNVPANWEVIAVHPVDEMKVIYIDQPKGKYDE